MKKILIILAIISIIIASIPSIYSLFSGEHSFYDTQEKEKNCLKCHSDVKTELDNADYHKSLICEDCHLNGSSYISHDDIIRPRCLDCHLSFTNDSHDPLILSAISSKVNKEENEACISCHTKKSIDVKFSYADTYNYITKRDTGTGGWEISGSKDNAGIIYDIKTGTGTGIGKGDHSFSNQQTCEKCHLNVREELNGSTYHSGLTCKDCHLMNASKSHSSNTPLCKNCHIISENESDAHILDINIGNDKCSSCHSSFNNTIEFIRPEYIEWDVVNVTDINNNSKWIIENVVFGPNNRIDIKKLGGDGKLHNISGKDKIDCTSCHQDIRDAVIKGGHSNEQWKNKHIYGSDMNAYCRSCHFNSLNHGGVKISCLDCHDKNNGHMGIEESIREQKLFIQSYLCISCKNTGNPTPYGNESLHFKLYTEPDVTIYVNNSHKR